MMILAIETSCDETSVSLVDPQAAHGEQIKSNLVYSQLEEHRAFGGVVPEVAARAHVERIGALVSQSFADTHIDWPSITALAVTAGPGLIGGLIVGVSTAHGLALGSGKPLLGIHHLEGHALTARLNDDIAFPYLALLVSGGHTMFLAVEGVGRYRRLGTTIDDALGEAFDKVAKWLGLGYPGGPLLEKLAAHGNPNAFILPEPMKGRPGADFSFSGLKTAVRLAGEAAMPLSDQGRADLAASFQSTVIRILDERCNRALDLWQDMYKTLPNALVVAGGVAANKPLRLAIKQLGVNRAVPVILPPVQLCGDNAAMIGWAASERWKLRPIGDTSVTAKARWPLESVSPPAE